MEGERKRGEIDGLGRERVGGVVPKGGSRRRRSSCEGGGAEELEETVIEEPEREEPDSEDVRLRSKDDEHDGAG